MRFQCDATLADLRARNDQDQEVFPSEECFDCNTTSLSQCNEFSGGNCIYPINIAVSAAVASIDLNATATNPGAKVQCIDTTKQTPLNCRNVTLGGPGSSRTLTIFVEAQGASNFTFNYSVIVHRQYSWKWERLGTQIGNLSDDRTCSMQSAAATSGSNIVVSSCCDANKDNALWLSRNSGLTWNLQASSVGQTLPWYSTLQPNFLWMGGDNLLMVGNVGWPLDPRAPSCVHYDSYNCTHIWFSSDAGATWVQHASGAPFGNRMGFALTWIGSQSALLMAGRNAAGYDFNDVWRTDDSGTSWSLVANASWAGREEFGSIGFGGSELFVAGGMDMDMGAFEDPFFSDVWRSLDAGISWQLAANNTAFGQWESTPQLVLVGGATMPGTMALVKQDTTTVWITSDYGSTWQREPDWFCDKTRDCRKTFVVHSAGSIVVIGLHNTTDVWRATVSM